ncbi:MAG: DotU family type IV/VI secretion system protein [Ignavibacteriaceae bacterium]|nr:DotU family type IV/VI secretion system protein [Ignavibacteriaceae bacterium]HMN24231.1 type IVB secretion system protein IcmH/DotU [Ignavibacteriaceae bacterium]HRQ53347.1 type IVB secretion system protein IcmH/DotU [Ignavibacteriaceae bacterium]
MIPVQAIDKKKNLSDIASECFILILQLRATTNYGTADVLKSKVLDMFDKFENNARKIGVDNEKVRLAKFALVAFLDETIISSDWSEKNEWLTEPLQIKLFDTFNAGEEFFTNMSTLRQRTSANKDVLEIYYLCLSLGFKGKYQLQSPENLRRIIDDLNLELHPEAYRSIDLLSPNGKPRQSIVQTVKTGLPLWIYPVGAIVILLIFYVILSFSISGKLDDAMDILNSLRS